MGANMARRLKDVGYPVTAVYDVRKDVAAELGAELGAEACTKLSRVTELSDVIITVVTDDKAMVKIFGGKGDNLLKGAKGRVFINCATISPKTHIAVEKLAKKAGAKTLEGCMASSITQAREGSLYLMCGGDKAVFDQVLPILEKLSKELRYIGPSGKGGPGEGAGKHGHEHQHGGPRGRSRPRLSARDRSQDTHGSVLPNGRELAGARHRWRGHDESRSCLFLQC
jgi:3-hydroxyisobutyrate dehydrogenase-like beta-hydroxyacid dehydrogenase